MIIYFEGIDKTGKTTLAKKFLEMTNYRHTVYDRGPISQIVYDTVFNRKTDDELFKMLDALRKCKVLVVLCEAPNELVKQRLKEHNEEIGKELSNFDEMKNLFRAVCKVSQFDYFVLNTSKPIDECLSIIANKVDAYV